MIDQPDCRKTTARIAPAIRSGQREAVNQTATPVAATTRLWIRSLRVHSQTERTLASPSRWRTSSSAARALAKKPRAPRPVMTTPSGGAPEVARQIA